MSITVKFFASLREQLGISETSIDNASTVEDVWNSSTQHAKRPVNTLVAINLEYARLSDTVNDGDEVAFFPPVTGG